MIPILTLAVADQKYLKRSIRCQDFDQVATETTLGVAKQAPEMVTLAAYNTHPDWMFLDIFPRLYLCICNYKDVL